MTDSKGVRPQAVGIIIDGNRRWAKLRGLPTLLGHKAGYDRVLEFLDWAHEEHVGTVYAYCFSTENWNRTTEEVNYLMDLLRSFFITETAERLKKRGYRVLVAGERHRLAHDIQESISKLERETAHHTKMTAVFCISYGGQHEILTAVNRLLEDKGREKGPITKERFEKYLWTAGLPDPDMVIRTSGEQRLSNFLTWRSVYSELFFPTIHWPDFSKKIFHELLEEYAARHRRFGK